MSDRHAATTLGKQIGTLFDLGLSARCRIEACSNALRVAASRQRQRLPLYSSATGRWSCGFAGRF